MVIDYGNMEMTYVSARILGKCLFYLEVDGVHGTFKFWVVHDNIVGCFIIK